MLEQGHVIQLEQASVPQDTRLGEHIVDAVHPFLGVAAAALEDEALLVPHAAQVVC